MAYDAVEKNSMRQHFETMYKNNLHYIQPITAWGSVIVDYNGSGIHIDGGNDEITQGCINRIVDNLNKLAEHNAQNRK